MTTEMKWDKRTRTYPEPKSDRRPVGTTKPKKKFTNKERNELTQRIMDNEAILWDKLAKLSADDHEDGREALDELEMDYKRLYSNNNR